MPFNGGGYENRVNERALRQHLLGLGLMPGSLKWFEVWHRKARQLRFRVWR
jgi:hypothetical protein